jgi:hypothetical protein
VTGLCLLNGTSQRAWRQRGRGPVAYQVIRHRTCANCSSASTTSPASPFAEPGSPREVADVRWVAPVLVGEVEFRQWIVNPDTGTHRLRHPSWRGLRADKAADEVVLDVDSPP